MATVDEEARGNRLADTRLSSNLSRWTDNPFALLPTFTALGLAGLYAVGALLKTTQLMGANLTVRDTLPLVPLPQLLAAGIGTVMQSLFLVPVFAGMVASVRLFEQRRRARDHRRDRLFEHVAQATTDEAKTAALQRVLQSLESTVKRYRLIALGMCFMIGVSVCAIVLFMPWDVAITMIMLLGFLMFIAIRFKPRPMVMLGIYLCSFPIVIIVVAFIWPAPLPKAELSLGAEKISGPLIAATDSVWYVKVADHTVRAAPVQDIRVPQFVSTSTPQKPSLWDLMHNRG